MFNKPISEPDLLKWVGFTLVFMLLMFSRDFGQIYIAMVVVWLMFFLFDKLIFDKRTQFPIEKSAGGRLESILIALIAYASFLFLTTIITNLFLPGTFTGSVKEVISKMGIGIVQASGPVLQNSKILLLLGWGLLIPIVETILFNGKVFEALYDKLRWAGLNMRRLTSPTLIILIIIIGATSALYHLTSKNLETVPLMITFVFFTVSGILVVWRGHLREAIYIHCIGNTIAVLSTMGAI